MDKIKNQSENLEIVTMEKSMLKEVAQIASMTLGSSFVDESILNNDINLCARSGTKIFGYCTTKFINLDYLKKILKNKTLELPKEYEKVAYIDSLAVNTDFAGKGVGTLLFKSTILKLKENNIKFVIMAGWKNGTEVNIKGLALKEGFKEEFEIENFWKEDSLEYNFNCTACGKPPCLCSAVIYTKVLV